MIRTNVPDRFYNKRLGKKRYPKDLEFSKLIRTRADWKCERCGKTPISRQGLHAAHLYSRYIMRTRWNPDNAYSLCQMCHILFATHIEQYHEWVLTKIGQKRYNKLYREATTL